MSDQGHSSSSPATNNRMWKNQGGKSVGLLPGRESLGPLALMLITPIFIFVLWYTMYHLHGDFGEMLEGFKQVRARGLWCLSVV